MRKGRCLEMGTAIDLGETASRHHRPSLGRSPFRRRSLDFRWCLGKSPASPPRVAPANVLCPLSRVAAQGGNAGAGAGGLKHIMLSACVQVHLHPGAIVHCIASVWSLKRADCGKVDAGNLEPGWESRTKA